MIAELLLRFFVSAAIDVMVREQRAHPWPRSVAEERARLVVSRFVAMRGISVSTERA